MPKIGNIDFNNDVTKGKVEIAMPSGEKIIVTREAEPKTGLVRAFVALVLTNGNKIKTELALRDNISPTFTESGPTRRAT
jgi:hypothetical protein